MNIPRPEIFLYGIQIKSEESFHRLAAAVTEIEEQTGIHEVTITVNRVFFCPWIKKANCRKTPMERLLLGIIQKQTKQ